MLICVLGWACLNVCWFGPIGLGALVCLLGWARYYIVCGILGKLAKLRAYDGKGKDAA